MTKKVMVKAWEIARDGAAKFGGKVSEYFTEALKMAWALVKQPSINERYKELKFHVRATHDELRGKMDEMYMTVTDLLNSTGLEMETLENNLEWIDPSYAMWFEHEVNGIVCNVYVMKKYIHEM